MVVFLVFGMVFPAAHAATPEPKMSYLDNGTVRIGVIGDGGNHFPGHA